MPLFKPKYITHYLPLFDNSTDRNGGLVDRRSEVTEGEVRFQRNGVVVLGSTGFGYTRPIVDVKFGGGCVANRDMSDQVLVIRNPQGEEYRYRYLERDNNWYRLILVERAPHELMLVIHAMREGVADYGPVIGITVGLIRILMALGIQLVYWTFTIGMLALIAFATRWGIQRGYGHLDPSTVRQMICLIWIGEALIIGLLMLGDWASAKGGKFFRVVLPATYVVCLLTIFIMQFSRGTNLLQTVIAFKELRIEGDSK